LGCSKTAEAPAAAVAKELGTSGAVKKQHAG
jgi:hypothetical protein